MQVKRKKVRVLKVLRKSILGLLIFLLGLLLVVHLPFVQSYISKQLPGFLSDRIGSKVELQKIGFSILGCAEVQGLKVWNPNDELILSLDTLALKANFFDVLSGDLHLEKVKLNGVYGRLTQEQTKELNIQFIIDAFAGAEKTDASSSSFQLRCDSVILEEIDFAFESISNDVTVSTKLDFIAGINIHISPAPVMVSVDAISMLHSELDIFIINTNEDENISPAAEMDKLISLDIDLDFGISVNALEIAETSFGLQFDSILQTPKFDPKHITVDQTHLEASNILLHKDTLNFDLLALSAQLPGFDLSSGSAEVLMNHEQFDVSKLVVDFANSNINAELQTGYKDNKSTKPNLALEATGQLSLEDISYFLPDSIEAIFDQWTDVSFALDANSLTPGTENVAIDLKTANSHLAIAGEVSDVLDYDNIAWNNLAIQSSIGNDFRALLIALLGESNLPPDEINLQLTSSGSMEKVGVDGRLETSWGSVDLKGDLMSNKSGIDLDMQLSSKNLMLGDYLNSKWLGPAELSISLNGTVGAVQNLQVDGLISSIEISEREIREIQVAGHLMHDSLTTTLTISDSNYRSEIILVGDLGSPMRFSSTLLLDEFKIGNLISAESALLISGAFKADMTIEPSTIQAHIDGTDLMVVNNESFYSLDSLVGMISLSPDSSYFEYQAEDGQVGLSANFDFREMGEVLNALSSQVLYGKAYTFAKEGSREFNLMANLDDSGLLFLVGMDIDSFSSLQIDGSWKEADQIFKLNANTGLISSAGISYDTLDVNIDAIGANINSNILSENLLYQGLELGNLNFDMESKTDTSKSSLRLIYDSIKVLSLDTRIFMNDDGVTIFPDEFIVYDQPYQISPNSPIFFNKENAAVSDLTIIRDDMKISLDGDLNEFDLELVNLNLAYLDPILFPDSTVINSGSLNGVISLIKGQQLDIKAEVDSLILLNSTPMTINLQAETNDGNVPFEFLLSNGESNINVTGNYGFDQNELDASLLMDIDSLEMFRIFYNGFLDDVSGAIKGEAKIQGSLQKPVFDGYMRFRDLDFSTKNPKLSFNVKNDSIQFNNEGLALNDFIIFDNLKNQLHVSGGITNDDYKSLSYDLNIKTDHYALINRPESVDENLKGLLVLGTDINLKGNEKDTYITADILIKDTTNLVLTLPDKQNQLLNTDGIIEFVEPSMLLDSTIQIQNESAYDSIIAGLPDFTFTSKILIEADAGLTIHIDPQSGDYFKVAGRAELDLAYDRTGNPMLNGVYVVSDGVYSLSFYDLVKKDFNLVKGSSISWAGGPEDGALDIKAVYSIASNSIGLVGHEVGENEKSIYKKSLNYEIGILIKGTIEEPEIKFSLDLPEEDKNTYPVLASKLDRLQLPEFQSDLNKQVFGLLVLGGFLPETSAAADANQNQIATTALYNSVNSVLSGQLNRFASQYIKGVDIDVGIQSYNDYASNGGKTKTAMDFHVSKSLMNDRLVFEVGGDFDISTDQSGANTGNAYRGDMAIIYDLTGNGDKQLKLFNNESYDIIYQEIRNTGISLIFIREFDKGERKKKNK